LIIPARVNASLPAEISKEDLKSVVDWFEKHQRSFYVLGWSYLRDQQQLEELFYQTILKVQKDFPKIKRKTSFDTWVTKVFIHKCRELAASGSLEASKEDDAHRELFNALNQLKGQEREALVFTYLRGLSSEETANLLQLSVIEVKELLVSGILSLRNGFRFGERFKGCVEYQKFYFDYLERNMERPLKIDFEKHIYHCLDCQEDLAAFQEVQLHLTQTMEEFQVPAGFMESIKERIAKTENMRQQKNNKRKRIGFIAASVLTILMCTGFFTGAFAKVYYSWSEENPELRPFLQANLGERLNLEAENNGVKIKIKSVIADDVQTLIFYEIEDTKKNNQYMINFDDGVFVEDEPSIMNEQMYPPYNPPDLESDLNKEEQNTYHGKLSLRPLVKDNATVKLKITKMMKLTRGSSVRDTFNGSLEEARGEWDFEIPVAKQPSTEYELDKDIEVEGLPVKMEKLILAPTATLLQYSMDHAQSGKKRINNIDFASLEVNKKTLKADLYGGASLDSWHGYQAQFEPLFAKKAGEAQIKFKRLYLSFDDYKSIRLNPSKEYPQTFNYAGSSISIDKVEVGQPTTVILSNHEIKDRAYESFHFNIVTEESENTSMEMESEGVYVDKSGKEYDIHQITPALFEKLENLRHFSTIERVKIQGDNLVPKAIDIYGYSTTKYLEDVVKISLD
jgi:RNA polymerase sigma factor (sigma-70 family)